MLQNADIMVGKRLFLTLQKSNAEVLQIMQRISAKYPEEVVWARKNGEKHRKLPVLQNSRKVSNCEFPIIYIWEQNLKKNNAKVRQLRKFNDFFFHVVQKYGEQDQYWIWKGNYVLKGPMYGDAHAKRTFMDITHMNY